MNRMSAPFSSMRVAQLCLSTWQQPFAVSQKTVDWVCQVSGPLFHPRPVRMVADSRDRHSTRGHLTDEEHVESNQPPQSPRFHREQVGCGQAVPMRLQEFFGSLNISTWDGTTRA